MSGELSLAILSSFWLGLLVALAIEARVKFNAPTLTRAVGLDVGRHVFSVFARVEWVLLAALAVFVLVLEPDVSVFVPASVVIVAVLTQSIWLRPSLNERAAKIIAGEDVPQSRVHLSYLFAEFLKMAALIALIAAGSLSA